MKRTNKVTILMTMLLGIIAVLLFVAPLIQAVSINHVHYLHRGAVGVLFNPMPISGIILVYLMMSIYRRRRAALIGSLLIVAVTLCYILLFDIRVIPAVLLIILTILMTSYITIGLLLKNRFTIKSNQSNIATVIKTAIVVVVTGLTYGTVGFLLLGPKYFHQTFTAIDAFISSLQTIVTLGDAVDEPTKVATIFVNSLIGVGVSVLLLVIQSFLRPLRAVSVSLRSDRILARSILEKTSVSSEDFFKLWPEDKHYFFSKTRRSFICYKHKRRTAIVLGDPSGDLDEFAKTIVDFRDFASQNGWSVAVINATDISKGYYIQSGLADLFVGNEAIIDVDSFALTTINNKHFRYVFNKSQRDGLTVEDWGHPSDKQLTTLRQISDEWLGRAGRREYTFFMGYYDVQYLRRCRIFVLIEQGKPVAYINLIPTFTPLLASIDHLRSRSDVSSAGMHFLLMNILSQLNNESVKTLNIGFAPLSGLSHTSDDKRVSMKTLLSFIRRIGNRYYSFKGIEQFKGKFQPQWQSRSLLYSGGIAELPRIIGDIELASNFTRPISRFRIIAAIILTVALITILYTLLP